MARPIDPFRLIATLVAVVLIAEACGTSRPRVTPQAADGCALVASPSSPIDSASIVVTSPVDARNAPHPTTWGERFVFGLAFDTVPRLDCHGRPVADVAGPYRILQTGRSTLLLEPVNGARGPRLTIHSVDDANARDLIDAGVDLVLTERPAIATYASTRGDVASVPLGWDRTWVFVSALPGGLGLDSASTVRSGLARDVVPADARAADGPYWWRDTARCGIEASAPASMTPASPASARIVYPRDEPIARALAERLVALAGAGTVATGLAPNAFASALKAGTELGYVFPLERLPLDRCRAAGDLLVGAPWLVQASNAGDAIAPLIDTRLRAVIKRDRLGVTITRDSTIAIQSRRP